MRRAILALVTLLVGLGLLARAAQAGEPGPAPPVLIPPPTPETILNLDLSTGGRVAIQLRPDKAPAHVERIRTLARQGFYDNQLFHRVIEGFMAQTGDPTGTGEGGSPLPDLKAEFNDLPHLRGTVSMARSDERDSANSQFFICFGPAFALDRKYTAFGRVIRGMEFVDRIERGEPPANPTRILKASIEADRVPPPAVATALPVPPPRRPTPGLPGSAAVPSEARDASDVPADVPASAVPSRPR